MLSTAGTTCSGRISENAGSSPSRSRGLVASMIAFRGWAKRQGVAPFPENQARARPPRRCGRARRSIARMTAVDTPLTLPVRELLRRSTLFRHLDDDELTALAEALEWFVLPGGATLFEAGE